MRLTKSVYDALREEMRVEYARRVRMGDPFRTHQQQMRICRLDMAYMRQQEWADEWADYTEAGMLRVMEILDSSPTNKQHYT